MKKFLIVYFLLVSSYVHADIIQLKSGKTVEGEIISQNEDEVKINFSGTQVTYFMEDVEKISEQKNAQKSFLEEYENPTTEWGEWLNKMKPYFDQTEEAIKKNISSMANVNIEGLSTQEIHDTVNMGNAGFYKELKKIVPPPEFKDYHKKILKAYEVLGTPMDLEKLLGGGPSAIKQWGEKLNADVEKYTNEARNEFSSVMLSHGVPE